MKKVKLHLKTLLFSIILCLAIDSLIIPVTKLIYSLSINETVIRILYSFKAHPLKFMIAIYYLIYKVLNKTFRLKDVFVAILIMALISILQALSGLI